MRQSSFVVVVVFLSRASLTAIQIANVFCVLSAHPVHAKNILKSQERNKREVILCEVRIPVQPVLLCL